MPTCHYCGQEFKHYHSRSPVTLYEDGQTVLMHPHCRGDYWAEHHFGGGQGRTPQDVYYTATAGFWTLVVGICAVALAMLAKCCGWL